MVTATQHQFRSKVPHLSRGILASADPALMGKSASELRMMFISSAREDLDTDD